MTTTPRLVVIGGDAAGMIAAAQARRRRPLDELEIVAFERGQHTSYSACGIPYLVGGVLDDADDLVARTPEEHRARGIDVRLGHEVVAIDTARQVVRARRVDDGSEVEEHYDDLVIATGATPNRPPLEGADAEGVFGVQTLADGIALHDVVRNAVPEHAVIVGCGYVGLELGEALVERGSRVALIDKASHPLTTLDPDMGALVTDALRGIGMELHLETTVVGFAVEDGHVRAVRAGALTLPADLVILGLGVSPNSRLASEAGIAVGATRGIVVDDHMRTSAEHVWAAGDCVETIHRLSGKPVAIALGTHANKQGRVVGVNVTGGDLTFPGAVGTAMTKVCAYEVARTGLNEHEAVAAGIDAVAVTIEATTRAGYFPDSSVITVKMIAARDTGRVLGAQLIGKEGAAKRVDVVAAAVWNEMTVEELVGLDVGYAPPFSPLWDPILVAARRLADERV